MSATLTCDDANTTDAMTNDLARARRQIVSPVVAAAHRARAAHVPAGPPRQREGTPAVGVVRARTIFTTPTRFEDAHARNSNRVLHFPSPPATRVRDLPAVT